MLDAYWDEKDTPYSNYFYLWTDWLLQYYNEVPLYNSIESAYLVWKSEQHRMTPNYYILHLLMPLVKKCFVTMEEYANQLKIACRCFIDFVTRKGMSV